MRFSSLLLGLVLCTFGQGSALAIVTLPEKPITSLLVGSSAAFYPSGPWQGAAAGIGAEYRFHITRRFHLGLSLKARVRQKQMRDWNMVYGTNLRHSFQWLGLNQELSYGLLMQSIHPHQSQGSAAAHDTRLGWGAYVFGSVFMEISYHISRLRYLEQSSENLDHIELAIWQAL